MMNQILNFRQNTANVNDIKLKDYPAYEKVQKETRIKLEQCPAYGANLQVDFSDFKVGLYS
jgi:hypothetical protein